MAKRMKPVETFGHVRKRDETLTDVHPPGVSEGYLRLITKRGYRLARVRIVEVAPKKAKGRAG